VDAEDSDRVPRSVPLRSKGTVTIPSDLRVRLNLREGDNLLVRVQNDEIVLTPAALVPRTRRGD
jgi:AbrB family looped-hinge helix DNA binding protein